MKHLLFTSADWSMSGISQILLDTSRKDVEVTRVPYKDMGEEKPVIREPKNSHNYIRLTKSDVELLLNNMDDNDSLTIYTNVTKYD